MTKKKKLREKFEAIAWAYSQELDQMKSKHQIFKGYQAVFESGLQFILQLTIHCVPGSSNPDSISELASSRGGEYPPTFDLKFRVLSLDM